jgi:hypothetical protein
VGHEYVLALVWKPAECDEGDETIPARWMVTGTYGAVPADEGVVGIGEDEGVAVSNVAEAASAARESDALGEELGEVEVADQFRGQAPGAIGKALSATVPQQAKAAAAAVQEDLGEGCLAE